MFIAKDFIETTEGLKFAVVANGVEQNKVLCFLRYVREADGGWKKYPTDAANALLRAQYPDYLYYSAQLDAHLHAVALDNITQHYRPTQGLQAILQRAFKDSVEQDLADLALLFQDHGVDLTQTGITGSMLLGLHNPASDIDWVCYQRDVFHHCRRVMPQLIEEGHLQALSHQDWQDSYHRRDASLSFADYVWHEQRKMNKALINGRKFDLNFVNPSVAPVSGHYQKIGAIRFQSRVVNADYAFDYPAKFTIDHDDIRTVVCFTATYTGQARTDELIEVAVQLEQDENGIKRLVVGTSREAQGEYIRVLNV